MSSSSSPPSTTPPPLRKKSGVFKTFTRAEIESRVAERAHDVQNYRELLMASMVREDNDAVTFDSTHPSWKRLLKAVRAAMKKKQEAVTITQAAAAPPTPSSSTPPTPTPPPNSSPTEDADDDNDGVDWVSQIQLEVESKSPDLATLRQACRKCGVPPSLRGRIWSLMLHVVVKEPLPEVVPFDLPNQRVVRADVHRTLGHMEKFQLEVTRNDMEVLLTLYCKRTFNVTYKQGMNYLMAPMFLLDLKSREEMYYMYVKLIDTLLPNTFTDDEFGGLQCIFALFRLLLLYHDPELCNFLDTNEIGPELYASSWFITLFANHRVDINIIMHLWDELILSCDEEPLLIYFFSLALLIANRDTVLNDDPVLLPQTLSNVRIHSIDEVKTLIAAAKDIRGKSTWSVRQQLRHFSSQIIDLEHDDTKYLFSALCVHIQATELITHCYGETDDNDSGGGGGGGGNDAIKFFILDCRPQRQYKAGYLPCSYHLDPQLTLEALAKEVDSLGSMRGCHFVFLDESDHVKGSQIELIILAFIKKGFKYVSIVDGGYQKCHECVVDNGLMLIDHSEALCSACSPHKNRGLFSAFRSRISVMLAERQALAATKGGGVGVSGKHHDGVLAETTVPDTTLVVDQTTEVRLLLTILRDRKAVAAEVSHVTVRLASIALGAVLMEMRTSEWDVTTPTGGLYSGIHCFTFVCGVTLSAVDELILRHTFAPFNTLAHVVMGEVRVTDSGTLTASKLPPDVAARHCVVFISCLGVKEATQIMTVCDELISQRDVEEVTIMAIVAARPALWTIAERFPSILLVCVAVDEYTQQRLVPGVGLLADRMDISTLASSDEPALDKSNDSFVHVPTDGSSNNNTS